MAYVALGKGFINSEMLRQRNLKPEDMIACKDLFGYILAPTLDVATINLQAKLIISTGRTFVPLGTSILL